MGYPPRLFEPDAIQFITSRTIEQTLFMVPTPAVVNAIGAVLANQQQRHGIEIFDVVFLANHFHLAARAPRQNFPDFMRDLKAGIAVAVNRLINRRGHFWERRYMASPILDEDAQVARAQYIYGHGVKEGLVDRPDEWPGVASVKERLSGVSVDYDLVDYTAMSRAAYRTKQPQSPGKFTKKVRLQLSPWPFLEELTPEQISACVAELVEQACEQTAAVRDGKASLGVANVLTQDPRDRPRSVKRSPKPLCHASSKRQRVEFRKRYMGFVGAYMEASKQFRAGDVNAVFPLYSYRPPVPRTWSPNTGGVLPLTG